MLEVARRRRRRRDASSRATRSRCPSRTGRSSASSPATSTAISRSPSASRFLAEARRVAPELVVVDSALRDDAEPEEWQERILNDGSRWTVFKRYFDARDARRRARRRRDRLRRPLVRRRPRRGDAPALELPLARVAPARQPGVPRLRGGRVPARVAAGRRSAYAGQRAYLFGQAPGIVEGEERRPWRGRAGADAAPLARARRGRVLRDVLLRLGHALLPGHGAAGRGDRTPTPREQELCSFWRDWELELLRPRLVVPVGGLAAPPPARPRGADRRDRQRFELDDSGRSRSRTRPARAAG